MTASPQDQRDIAIEKQRSKDWLILLLKELDRVDQDQDLTQATKQQTYDRMVRQAGMLAINLFGPHIRFPTNQFMEQALMQNASVAPNGDVKC